MRRQSDRRPSFTGNVGHSNARSTGSAGSPCLSCATTTLTGCYSCVVSERVNVLLCRCIRERRSAQVLLCRCLRLIKRGLHLGQARSTLVSLRLHNGRTLATRLDSAHRLGQIYGLRRPSPRGRMAGCTCNACVTQEVFSYVDGFLFEGFCFFLFNLFQFRGF
jgi:hypothetical protein